jgi:hypothetical protein
VAHRVEIRPRPDGAVAVHLLRGHVHRRPDRARGLPAALRHHLGDAEVEDLEPRRAVVAEGHEQVLGLEIAVDDSRRVGLVEGEGDLMQVLHDLVRREATAPGQEDGEVLPAEQLHDQERRAGRLVDPRVQRLHDVLALDVGRDRGLELEPAAQLGLGDQAGEHDLEGAAALGLELDRLVDRAHPPRLMQRTISYWPWKMVPGDSASGFWSVTGSRRG